MKKLTGIVLGLAFMLCAFSASAVYAQGIPQPGDNCTQDSDCNDFLYCNGIETCVQSSPGEQSVCVSGSDPCGDDTPVCDEDNNTCVECLTDDNCTEGEFCVDNVCVECRDRDDCPDDGDPCNGAEICVEGQCDSSGNPCPPGELCFPVQLPESLPAGATPTNFICGECDNDTDCDDGLFCTGPEICDDGTCLSLGNPCLGAFNSVPAAFGPICDEENDACVECISDDNCTDNATPFCVENTCVECRVNDDCDNDLFCDGDETCDNGTCLDGVPPCDDNGTMPLCDEDNDTCVECFDDGDCVEGDNNTPLCDGVMCVQCINDSDCDNDTFCREGECVEAACGLSIKPRKVRINKKFRPVERMFRIKGIRGEECFDPYAEVDFGLIIVRRAVVTKKGVLKVLATIPSGVGLNKGPYQIRVGDAVGEILLK